jgi:hypothetical protein
VYLGTKLTYLIDLTDVVPYLEDMRAARKLQVVKELIEEGKIRTLEDIFDYVSRTFLATELGIKYKRFLRLVRNPKTIKYGETYSIAKLLSVDAKLISGMIHNQINGPAKPKKAKPKV